MQFGLIEMWTQMTFVAKAVAIILLGLSLVSLYLLIERILTYSAAKSKSREVAPKLSDLLKKGMIAEALSLSSRGEFTGSHLARVTAGGTREYIEAKQSNLDTQELIDSAERGCMRASTMFEQELRRGLSWLATIATSSPFIGLFGTIFGIMNAFRGMARTGSGGIGAVASGIAEALITTAVGILVAIIALWIYNYLNSRIDIYKAEMSNTSSQLLDYFIRKESK
jgi:biopolymer transport protein ExbB/TolQ